jgi:uncharacterized protein
MTENSIRVIFDTNIWISFLIGKKLASMKDHISSGNITIITSPQLIEEIRQVTGREKLKKYFPKRAVTELLELLEVIAENIDPQPKHFICRDAKDNFLLDLIDGSKADYLVTGDKDLLEHDPFKTAAIITSSEFEKILVTSPKIG